MNGSKFAFLALCLVFFLACSDIDVIDPYTRAGAPTALEASSSSSELSSSSDTGSSSSGADSGSSSSGVVFESCGALLFNPATHFCFNGTPYELCGGTKDYDPPTQYCFNNSKVGTICGTRAERFDPDLYECRDGDKIYLKTKFKDDGDNEYEAVLIGSQTWMAKNLNVVADGSKCYHNLDANCDTYGRLYNWATAMNIEDRYNDESYTVQAKHRGICPSGWHIPSTAEWSTLVNHADSLTSGIKLKASSIWRSNTGTDIYGFAAFPGGNINDAGTSFSLTENGIWWSATEFDRSKAWGWRMTHDNSYADRGNANKPNLYSIRCVKDGE